MVFAWPEDENDGLGMVPNCRVPIKAVKNYGIWNFSINFAAENSKTSAMKT